MLSLVENLFLPKNPLQDFFFSSLNPVISTNESTQSITGHVIYDLAYTYKFQLKTTQEIHFLENGLICVLFKKQLALVFSKNLFTYLVDP